MSLLYGLFALMLVTSIGLIALPFRGSHKASYVKPFFLISVIAISYAFSMYYFFGSQPELKKWLVQGKQHYDLREAFKKLGGVEGAIERVKQKLVENPNDKTGWIILSKLYLSKGDKKNADLALSKAQELPS